MNSTECHSVYRIHRRLIRERWIKRLRGCPNVQAFVDDTCAHSKDFDAHLDHLDQTLGRFNRAGIQLRIDKCSFGYEEVDFLGHRVSSKGRRPLPTTLSKISKFPRPRSRKEVRQFMWLVNWYRLMVYLQAASRVVIITDHHPLEWLRRQRDPRNKYARWILEFEPINYEIQ